MSNWFKKYLVLFYIIGITSELLAQNSSYSTPTRINKPFIDSAAISNWSSLGDIIVCNNGKYVQYIIKNKPIGNVTLVVQSTIDSWKQEFVGASLGRFSNDGKQAFFMRRDTLYILVLGTTRLNTVGNVFNNKWPESISGEWIAYKVNNSNKELIFQNMSSGELKRFSSVEDYSFNRQGDFALLKTETAADDAFITELKWVNLKNNKVAKIWSGRSNLKGPKIEINYSFDIEGNQITFLVNDKVKESNCTIWYFKDGMNEAELKFSNDILKPKENIVINNTFPKFSNNGENILIQLIKFDTSSNKCASIQGVDIWSYKDQVLQSEQPLQKSPQTFTVALNVRNNKVTFLGSNNEFNSIISEAGDFILTKEVAERTLNSDSVDARQYYYLICLKDGTKTLIKEDTITALYDFAFSTRGKYLVYWDRNKKAYFCYCLLNGKTKKIFQAYQIDHDPEYDKLTKFSTPFGIATWLEDDTAILMYDKYDVLKIDPTGNNSPLNITNGYGAKQHIVFRLVRNNEIFNKDYILFKSFNLLNKYNGFYRKKLNEKGDPELLTMGPYKYQIFNYIFVKDSDRTLKGKSWNIGNKVWVVARTSTTEALNYFLTKDFKNYFRITALKPEQKYNWLTAELLKWQQSDGTLLDGILYKPEDFDPHKKYPLIFNYYEVKSNLLYEYPEVKFTNNEINIPWFVSRGYLVFTPDIHFSMANKSGKTNGDYTIDAIVSAAKYLSKMSWVDSTKMGIDGHSFGGFQTNYIITETDIFAAAAEAAGTSDIVSSYLSLTGPLGKPKTDRMKLYEETQGRIGATLWQRPDLYIKSSPIFKAHQVHTPLLMMHNMGDPAVPWGNGLEFYLALRRLGKKVWMLQYDGEGHSLMNKKNQLDYTIRLTQFFDYYLKDALPPKWMIEGIPRKLKGIETGYELDYSGRKP
jgi:dienelactone hydrolase